MTDNENTKIKRKYTGYLKIFWICFIIPVIAIITLFVLIASDFFGRIPAFDILENPKSDLSSQVLSSDGQLLGTFHRKNRIVISFDELSPHLINALVATEDHRFYSHSGIDIVAFGRVIKGLVSNKQQGGGSTISQQLAKNLFPRDTSKYNSKIKKITHIAITKFKEWVTAVKLERAYTKNEIIEIYLNTVPFGSGAFGIKSASKIFFNRQPSQLNREQSALMIGILNGPSLYNPVRNPKNAKSRRDKVLLQMQRAEYISSEIADSLIDLPVKINYTPQNHTTGLAPYLREYLRKTLSVAKPLRKNYAETNYLKFKTDSTEWADSPLYGWCNKNVKPDSSFYDIYRDGLKIYTTINFKMQNIAEKAMAKHLATNLQKEFDKEQEFSLTAPFAKSISKKKIEQLLLQSIYKSDRFKVAKLAGQDTSEIINDFEDPVAMKLFRWKNSIDSTTKIFYEEFDTVMSPFDSILFNKQYLHSGFVSMNPENGHVKAYVGGINFKNFKFDNVIQSKRQVGSTFKPFVYALAMIEGFSPCFKVANSPWYFDKENQKPKYDNTNRPGEMVSLKYGLANSLNNISAWIMNKYSPEAVINVVRKMGVKSKIDPVPAICVGAAEISLFEMVGAYCTFANKGLYTEPVFITKIEDKHGNLLQHFAPQKKLAMSEESAYLMLEMMKEVVRDGTASRLRYRYGFENEIAGKTGTTNNNSDGWFIGITPHLVSGCWVGGGTPAIRFRNSKLGCGANMALPIWALYMQQVQKDEKLYYNQRYFDIPDDLTIESDCEEYDKKMAQKKMKNSLMESDVLILHEKKSFSN